ncbi:IPT/TIG domain-containing protein [Chloroflexota bacterium]
MKYIKAFRILAVALVLALLVATVPVAPVMAAGEYLEITQSQGKIGDRIDVYLSFITASAQITLYFSDEVATLGERIDTDVDNYEKVVGSAYANPTGVLDAYFDVPSELSDGDDSNTKVRPGTFYVYLTYYGVKTIVAYDTITVESTGMITLDPDEGVVGTEVEITGEGFDDRENIVVEYDGDEVDIESGDDETDSSGDFECIILIPESTAGDHTIAVIGDDSEIEASAEFAVESKITIAPESGTTGDTVTVSGTGFGDRLDFSIFFDDDEVADDGTNRKGNFEVTFTVPSLAQGSYDIEVEDEDNNSDKVEFTITASTISLNPTSGYAGGMVTVSGSGFKTSSSISITFGGDTNPITAATSDASGKFSGTFTVPVRATGTYEVKASDGTNTLTANFDIGISATISPETTTAVPGYIGDEITIGGEGYTPGGTVTVTYDGTQVKTAIVGTNGDFSVTFNVPVSSGGAHPIIVTDGTNTEDFSFVVESTPPPIPAPLRPEMGIKAEAEAYFDWEDVTDASLPVTYTLQVATENFTSESFSQDSIVFEKTGLTLSEYAMTKEERLESVSKETPYYWHVKAVDGASNESEWAGTGSFYVGSTFSMSRGVVYTLVGIGALLLFVLGFWLGRKTSYF